MLTLTIPTRHRYAKLHRCLSTVDFTTDRLNIVLGATRPSDVLDPNTDEGVDDLFPYATVAYHDTREIVPFQNDMARQHPRGCLLPISDDITFQRGALNEAYDMLLFDGADVVDMRQRNIPTARGAFMMVASHVRDDINDGGAIFHNGYKHFFADEEAYELFCNNYNVMALEDAVVHHHPSTGAMCDKTHSRNRGDKWAHDFNLRKERQSVVERIRF